MKFWLPLRIDIIFVCKAKDSSVASHDMKCLFRRYRALHPIHLAPRVTSERSPNIPVFPKPTNAGTT
ncbi:hypothetical protein CW304_00680 [Bacillus sp. UFRGS-B20]|nr:hypothetical protein CW304_00680 [Bacillus sp. UFRGS-B20]